MMNIQYAGLTEVSGPLVCLDGVRGAAYDEMATLSLADGSKRVARVVEMEGERVVLQVLRGRRAYRSKTQKPPFREAA